MSASIDDIRKLLPGIKKELFGKANIVATGIGYKTVQGKSTDELSVICSVDTKKSIESLSKKDIVPARIQDIPTDINPVGLIHTQQLPTDRFRPAPGGVSIGHFLVTAGTLGCLVKKEGKTYLLSNNHVLANSNAASVGDVILQPGTFDGGINPQDQIAKLSEFIEIVFENGGGSSCPIAGNIAAFLNTLASITGSKTRLKPVSAIQQTENLVDCAIAEPLRDSDLVNEILGYGVISGITKGVLGMYIKKSGRTTGLTTGTIQQIDVTVRVSFGANRTALFTDQLLAGEMSQGGDSGSAVLSDDNKLVGLLFAGSNTTTIFNKIQNVFQLLNVNLV